MPLASTRSRAGSPGRFDRRSIAGALIILLLLAIALLIFFAADIVNAFRRTYVVHVAMESAPGLTEDAPVWVGGKPVGTVRAVGFAPAAAGSSSTATVIATLELPQDVAPQVRADSRVRLTSARLIGEPLLDIVPGTAAAPVLGDGDTLFAAPRTDPEQLTRRAAALMKEMDSVTLAVQQLRPLITRRMRDAQGALAAAQGAMTEADRLTTDLRSGAGLASLQDPAFRRSLASATDHVAALPAALERLQQQLGGAGETTAAIMRLRTRADSLNAALATLNARMQSTNGSALRFSQDTAIQRAMNGARAQLDSLIAEARSNPLRFVF